MRQVIKVLVIMQDNCERDSSKELERSLKPTLPFPCMFQVVMDNFVAFELTRMQYFDVIVIPQKVTEPFSVSTFIEILKTADGCVPAFIYLMDKAEEPQAIKQCKGRHVRYSSTGNIPIADLSQAIQALVEPEESVPTPTLATVSVPSARGPSQVSPLTFAETGLPPARSNLHVPRSRPLLPPTASSVTAPTATAVAVSSAAPAASVEVSPSPKPRSTAPKRQRAADSQPESNAHPAFRICPSQPGPSRSSCVSEPPPTHDSQEYATSLEGGDHHWQEMQSQAQQHFQSRYNPSLIRRAFQQLPAPHYQYSYPYQHPQHQHQPHHPHFPPQFPHQFTQPAPPAFHAFAPVQPHPCAAPAVHHNHNQLMSQQQARTQALLPPHHRQSACQPTPQQAAATHAHIPIAAEASPARGSSARVQLPSPAGWLDGMDLDHTVLEQLYSERF